VPWVVSGSLLAIFLIGGLVAGGGETVPPPPVPNPPENARALTVPTERARKIVVSACGEPVRGTARVVAERRTPAGTTIVELPRQPGDRTILVPHCQSKQAVSASGRASAALVAASGKRLTEVQGGGLSAGAIAAKSQVILPGGSAAAIVVIPPCRTPDAAKGRDALLPVERPGSAVVIAPSC
jgi:hypothetical protein